jgi:hypothetical protein
MNILISIGVFIILIGVTVLIKDRINMGDIFSSIFFAMLLYGILILMDIWILKNVNETKDIEKCECRCKCEEKIK